MIRKLACGALAALFLTTGAPAAQEPIKVGFVLALSGPGSILGKQMQAGADLALEQLGGEFAGRPVEFIYADSQRRPDVGKQAADKLVKSDEVDFVIGSSFSNVMMAIHGAVTRAETFLISPNAAPAPLAGRRCNKYFFSIPFQNDQPSEAMGKYMTDEGFETAFILAPNYQAGKDLLAGFKRRFEGEIVAETYTPLSQTDFSAELSAIRDADPDGVFVFYPGGLGIQFVKQYAQAGLRGEIPLLSAFTVDNATLPAQGADAKGVLSALPWAIDMDNAANNRFVEGFREAYDFLPAGYAQQAYDAVMLVNGAVEKLGGDLSDKDAVHAALKSAPFDSVRGDFEFNSNQFPIHDMVLRRVRTNERGEVIASYDGVIGEDMVDAYVDECAM